ncbi:hypothetical protein Poly51_36060 [Rubripirellula tenax]|uniref:Uncharacterized protein n=1 Tax=Rubripirellula tenax TaxID=2528015 RepID=A0A5C6F2N0_9BACT|nr:hypothetical protein Poly51_36060 [Rubripirellula tenax]
MDCTGVGLAAVSKWLTSLSRPGESGRYRTDSADVPLICLHKRLLQRPIGKLSFGICVSESAIQTY